MTRELWSLCFGDQPYDGESTLQDLYDVAVRHRPHELADYLQARLRVGPGAIAPHHVRFLRAPWQRIYTLNVDDLELAVARHLGLPCPPRLVTPWRHDGFGPLGSDPAPCDGLEVVHLNGIVTDDPRSVTFSTLQYASRLSGRSREPLYAALARDLVDHPFVFVGTSLDEVILWQHLHWVTDDRGRAFDDRPHSYLVATHVSQAREVLLRSFNVDWVPMTADAFARECLP
jgi:hypothetical protein